MPKLGSGKHNRGKGLIPDSFIKGVLGYETIDCHAHAREPEF